ncbi:MAG: hypothetical protein WB511_13445 [Nitrososphaeraceae archaeon]
MEQVIIKYQILSQELRRRNTTATILIELLNGNKERGVGGELHLPKGVQVKMLFHKPDDLDKSAKKLNC